MGSRRMNRTQEQAARVNSKGRGICEEETKRRDSREGP